MAEAGRTYSERLGAIRDEQFAAATARLGLGAFVRAEPIAAGLFGQNVFVTTTEGEFVLRGAPHWVPDGQGGWRQDDRVQFAAERYFMRLVHERTAAPVPWPCHHDTASDIFGWPYLVMPRMPGVSPDIFAFREVMAPQARDQAARSMGLTLGELQRLTAPHAGGHDADLDAIAPDDGGFGGHLARQLADLARHAEGASVMTAPDMAWIEAAARAAKAAPARPVTFVHGDFKPDNLTFAERDGVWRVSGVFDFHTARFGDGAFDLVRPALFFEAIEPPLARTLVSAWREAGGDAAGLADWLPLFVAAERLSLWAGSVKVDSRPEWAQSLTFSGWCDWSLTRLSRLIGG